MHTFTNAQSLQIALNDFLESHDVVYINGIFYDCELTCAYVVDYRFHFNAIFHVHTDTKMIIITHTFGKHRRNTEISAWFAGNGFIFPS